MNIFSHYKVVISAAALIAILLGSGTYLAFQRPWRFISFVHTPDDKHIHQVFGEEHITQRFIVPTESLAGIDLFIDSRQLPPTDTPLILHVRSANDTVDIRTVQSTFQDIYQPAASFEQYTDEVTLRITAPTLRFMFEPIMGAKGNMLDIMIEAPSAKKAQAIRLRYESDREKYLAGESFSDTEEKSGNIGFAIYEQPPLALLIWRWLLNRENVLVWIGGFLVAIGLWGLWILRRTSYHLESSPLWIERWRGVSWREFLPWALIILVSTVAIFWPATRLFFFHDDLAVMARVKHFSVTSPLLLFSGHHYVDVDEHSSFVFRFYRPVSFVLYPWLLWLLVGTYIPAYYFLNLLLLALLGNGLFIVSFFFLKSPPPALIATLVWLVHSTKVGTAYWWSSVQDILASIFALAAFILYTHTRSKPSARKWIAVGVLFFLALLSKEHVTVLPLAVLLSEILFTERKEQWWPWMRPHLYRLTPFVLVAGFFLIIRAVMMGDPTLPHDPFVDNTYAMSASPLIFARNSIVYAAWSAEEWLWPKNIPFKQAEVALEEWMARRKIDPPFYPGVVLIVVYLTLLAVWWKKKETRALLLFAATWWVLFLAPNLLMLYDWRFRWLMLSIWGMGLAIAAVVTFLASRYKEVRSTIYLTTVLILIFYGFTIARHPERTRFYTEQASYARAAYDQLQQQEERLQSDSVIYLIGVKPEQATSLSAYLFRFFSPRPFSHISRSDTVPDTIGEHDIIIDMTGLDAYYPEYER